MNRWNTYRIMGFVYFLFDFLVQAYWILIITGNEWIHRYSMHNSFILWCFAEGIFGKTKWMGWIAMAGILLITILSLVFCVLFFLNENSFFVIPMFIVVLNIVFHIVFQWNNLIAYVGLLYKVLGCIIYAQVVCKRYYKGHTQ